jgi:hypothetical protein
MAGLGSLEAEGRSEPIPERALDGRVRRQHRCQERAQDEDHDDRERDQRRPATVAVSSLEERGLGRGGAAHREYRIFGFR